MCMGPLERLADAEMDAPAACLRRAVHEQTRKRIELVAEVEPERPDWRLVAEPGANRVAKLAELEAEGFGPHITGVEEQHAAPGAAQHRAELFADHEHAVAADRRSRSTERAHFVAPPPANAGRAAEKELPRERHV